MSDWLRSDNMLGGPLVPLVTERVTKAELSYFCEMNSIAMWDEFFLSSSLTAIPD